MGEKCQCDLAESRRSNQVADVRDLTELLWKQLVLLPRHLDIFGGVDPLLPYIIDVEPVALVTIHNLKREGGKSCMYHMR